MRVWLSEKDSQARDLAAVLGNPRKTGRSSYQTNHGLVTAARGHLYTDLNPREYHPDWGFNIQALPFLPNPWRQKPRPDQAERIDEIQKALRQATEVVIATDAGAEGERIARTLIIHSGYRGPLKRLWLKALDPASIRNAINQIADGSASEGLYEASLARSKSDWLVGMNLSVLCTLLNQTLYPNSPRTDENKYPTLQTGRVKTPTAKLVVDRDKQIEDFVPRDFYHLEGNLFCDGQDTQVTLKYHPPDKERIFEPRLARTIAQKLVRQLSNLEITTEQKAESPKLPYDLLELQKACNRRWAWTAEQTLEVAQGLYDTHKIITYPRTDSRYLPEEQIPEIPDILANTYAAFPQAAIQGIVERDGKPVIRNRLYNSAKVGEHNAIVPTTKRPDLTQLNASELQLYILVLSRYLENLSPDYEYSKTTVTLPLFADDKVYPFKSSGSTPLRNGWKDILPAITGVADAADPEDKKPADNNEANTRFPPLRPGSPSWLNPIKTVKQTTKPPEHFTEATLLEAMRRIHEYEPDPEKQKLLKEKDIPGIGTPATRSKIIEELKTQNYLLVKKRKELHASPKAKQMVQVMKDHFSDFVSISTTALWQEKILQMEKGGVTHYALVNEVFGAIHKYVERHRATIISRSQGLTSGSAGATSPEDSAPRPTGETDPANGLPIEQNKYLYLYPSKPGIRIPKIIAQRPMTIPDYNALFADPNQKKYFEGFISKENKPFSCYLVFNPLAPGKSPTPGGSKKPQKPQSSFRFEFTSVQNGGNAPDPTGNGNGNGNGNANGNAQAPNNAPPNPATPTEVLYKKAPFMDHGKYWKCESVEGYFNKILSGRPMNLADYVRILESKSQGIAFEFVSPRTGKNYTARLVYRKKTKFNGRPGIEMAFD